MPEFDKQVSAGHLRNIHNEYRTALLNKKYYGARLATYRTVNRWFEAFIAIGATGATGTGIAGLTVWKSGYGIVVWGILSALSIALSTLKPILGLTKEIERYGKLFGEYANIFETLRFIEQDISAAQSLTHEQLKSFNQIRKRAAELAQLDDQNPKPGLVRQIQQEVNTAIPASSLWMPAPQPSPAAQPAVEAATQAVSEEIASSG